jgi:hypothetical protein
MQFKNESGLEFTDISSEAFREYTLANGGALRIDQPLHLHVSESGHRVFAADGTSHYIPKGWLALKWQAKEGSPHFVK